MATPSSSGSSRGRTPGKGSSSARGSGGKGAPPKGAAPKRSTSPAGRKPASGKSGGPKFGSAKAGGGGGSKGASRARAKPGTAGGGRSDRPGARGAGDDERGELPAAGRGWGGVARKGVGRLRSDEAGDASKVWRGAMDDARAAGQPPAPGLVDEWVLVEEVREEAERAVDRGGRSRRREASGPPTLEQEITEEVRGQLARAVGSGRGDRTEKRLREATRDFEAERFADAARILKPLADQAPGVPAVRELYGLTLYRQGKWKLAIKQLEAFRLLTGSTEQNPVLADCYRAMRQWSTVDELWDDLRAASPSGELVTEGRIVVAGAHADRGDVKGAIRLLEHGWSFPKRPRPHHLRRAYALADLYERAGDVPRARDLFSRIRAADPWFADVDGRLRSLA